MSVQPSASAPEFQKAKRSDIKYIFSLQNEILVKVKERENDLQKVSKESDKEKDKPSNKEAARLKHAPFLADIAAFKNTSMENKKYKKGKKIGKHYQFMHKNVKFKVRLDKIGKEFNPRVSKSSGKKDVQNNDKTTIELANLLDNKTDIYRKYFLMALRGGDYQYNEEDKVKLNNEGAIEAFTDGLEARVTVLVSDLIAYPGNGVITEKLLQTADESNYKALFTGDLYEGSYGALPSQNQNQKHENSAERVTPYKKLGEFISSGNITISSVATSVPSLRKFNALIKFCPDLINIKKLVTKDKEKTEEVISSSELDKEISSLTIIDRHQKLKKDYPKFEIFSEPEDNSDDELKKYKHLDAEKLTEMDQELQNKIVKIQRKKRIISKILKSKKAVSSGAENNQSELSPPSSPTNKEDWEVQIATKESLEEAEKIKKIAEALKKTAYDHGYQADDVPRDGLCFYHAVVDQIKERMPELKLPDYGLPTSGKASLILKVTSIQLRKLVCNHIKDNYKNHIADINDSLPELERRIPGETDESLRDRYLDYLLKSEYNPFANDFEIETLAKILNIKILVLKHDNSKPQCFHNFSNTKGTIYIGSEAKIHFRSLRDDKSTEAIEKRKNVNEEIAKSEGIANPSLNPISLSKAFKIAQNIASKKSFPEEDWITKGKSYKPNKSAAQQQVEKKSTAKGKINLSSSSSFSSNLSATSSSSSPTLAKNLSKFSSITAPIGSHNAVTTLTTTPKNKSHNNKESQSALPQLKYKNNDSEE